MKELLFNEGQNLKEVLCEISEYIYHNPELGNQEFKSSEKLISFLEEHNFIVEREFLGLKTAFRAVYDTDKRYAGKSDGYSKRIS